MIYKALTIAGSDSGGGAGIQADLKTFSAFNVHGMSAITSVTAQNTLDIRAIFYLPSPMVKKQIECIIEDIGVDSAKTGMLGNEKIIKAVASTISKAFKKKEFPVVVDPVMVAKSGVYLLQESAVDAFIKHIIPLAYIITPNKYEAEKLTGIKIKGKEDVKKCAKEIKKLGAHAVIIKGGHIGENATDILFHKGKFTEYEGRRLRGCTHGTGCSFSAAITANLAKGYNIEESIKIAKKFISTAIKYGVKIGHGHCPVNPISWIAIEAEKWKVYEELKMAVNKLLNDNIIDLIPEVGMNFAYALPYPYAKEMKDVASVEGRIVRAGEKARGGEIKFGSSRHLAKAILKAMEHNREMRAVMNIRYDKNILKKAKEIFNISFYNRQQEPAKIKKQEGATIPWGIEQAIKRVGKVPDIIYHEGDIGKEPMILILGKNPEDVLKKLTKLKI